jgi:hypothetical protein
MTVVGLAANFSFVWPEGDSPLWSVDGRWVQRDDQSIEVVRLQLAPLGQGHAIAADLVGQLLELVQAQAAKAAEVDRKGGYRAAQEVKHRARRVVLEHKASGRDVPASLDLLAAVAQNYVVALAAGRPPTQSVADQWAVGRSTAAGWVRKARALGLLDPATGRMARGVTNSEEEQR